MKIIFVHDNQAAAKSVVLKGWMRLGLSLCLLGLPVLLGYYGYQLVESRSSELRPDAASQTGARGLREQQAELGRHRPNVSQRQALASRLVNLQIRLDVLGEVLAIITGQERDSGFARHLNSFVGQAGWHQRAVDLAAGIGAGPHHGQEQALLALPGAVVKKGQVITRPGFFATRVLLAIHKHGRVVDPASYIHRTIR